MDATPHVTKFQRSVVACIENAERLLEDAEYWSGRQSTGLALALLAQEECAKAFVLGLIRDGIVPWTEEVHRSLSVHECKQLVTVIMEWLTAADEQALEKLASRDWPPSSLPNLPPDVATAMNIYRHEVIERIGRRYPERSAEWVGIARKLADGQRDRIKQGALYVRIGNDGSVASTPAVSRDALDEELVRTRAILQCAKTACHNHFIAAMEFRAFADIFRVMFQDLGPEAQDIEPEETFDVGIPGVVGVKCRIATATVVRAGSTESVDDTQ